MKKIKNISFQNVTINNGFWKFRQDLNKNVTIHAIKERFLETGRFDAVGFKVRETGVTPHLFYDSDIAKWIESISYLIINEKGGYEKEKKVIDDLVEIFKKNQLPDGYFNSYYIQIEPTKRFTERANHELYCAGHLIEAGVAYAIATGKTELLEIVKKYVDCIERYFVTEKLAKFYTPGHEEIELALVKLYDYTNDKKYLDLALYFINTRGTKEEQPGVYVAYNEKICQAEVPVRDLELAEGHSVRATYLYIAMSELASKTNDEELLKACKRIWRDIVDKKMYVTGGIGSTCYGEAFTCAYDLPNLEAYSESCASIGLLLFALSMQKSELNAEYGAIIEKIMYNGLLSSTSLDGKSFFYENPMEIHLASVNRETSSKPERKTRLPIRHRLEVFDCSCCPPNISRTIARVGELVFSEYGNSLVINQYVSASLNDGANDIEITTNYPNDFKVKIEVKKCAKDSLLLRIPDWCEEYGVSVDYKTKNGYIEISSKIKEIEIEFKAEPYFVECNPKSRANNGRVALLYGPIVYSVERLDNPYELNALSIDIANPVEVLSVQEEYPMRALKTKAYLDKGFSTLYQKVKAEKTEVELLFRPYWTFANREETDMLVWLRRK